MSQMGAEMNILKIHQGQNRAMELVASGLTFLEAHEAAGKLPYQNWVVTTDDVERYNSDEARAERRAPANTYNGEYETFPR